MSAGYFKMSPQSNIILWIIMIVSFTLLLFIGRELEQTVNQLKVNSEVNANKELVTREKIEGLLSQLNDQNLQMETLNQRIFDLENAFQTVRDVQVSTEENFEENLKCREEMDELGLRIDTGAALFSPNEKTLLNEFIINCDEELTVMERSLIKRIAPQGPETIRDPLAN